MYRAISFLLNLFAFMAISHGQDQGEEKKSHVGIYAQLLTTKQVVDYELVESQFKVGYAIGILQHFDLSDMSQLRVGCAIAGQQIAVKDYSPNFPDDFDPSTGEVDVYKSYLLMEANTLQLKLPVNVRFKLSNTAKHVYISGGLEGSLIINDNASAEILESGVNTIEVDPETYFELNKTNLAGQIEFGYEFPWKTNKVNLSVLSKYGITTQFKGNHFLTHESYNGHSLDLGLGLAVIF